MKILFLNCFLLMGVLLSAQSEVQFLESLKANNLEKLESHMASKVSFCLNDDTDIISKRAAISKIKSFFATNKIQQFKMLHKGKSSDKNSGYKVARLKTANGNYRVFAYSEDVKGKSKVVEIRINAM